jgi:hypothetical protein
MAANRGPTVEDRRTATRRALDGIGSGLDLGEIALALEPLHPKITPDLLDEVSWWPTNDLWIWSLYALAAYVRVAAGRTGEPVATICQRVAARNDVELGFALG